MISLYPHFTAGALYGIASGTACGLHEQGKQTLGGSEITGKKSGVGVHRRDQGDASKVVPFGNHLRAHQNIDFARMDRGQLAFECALEPRGVGVDAGNTNRTAIGPSDVRQQFGQVFLELLGATANRCNVKVAALRACAWHAFGEAAVVAAQGAVDFVEHAECTAMFAVAFPAAIGAMQHRCITTPIEQQHALFTTLYPRLQCRQQGGRQHGASRLLAHVHAAHLGQQTRANSGRHVQPHIAPAFCFRAALVPAFE